VATTAAAATTVATTAAAATAMATANTVTDTPNPGP
jgi:hypothetical protein